MNAVNKRMIQDKNTVNRKNDALKNGFVNLKGRRKHKVKV